MNNRNIVFTKLNTAEVVDRPLPKVGAGEVLVRLVRSCVSSGAERANLTGVPDNATSIHKVCPDDVVTWPRQGGYSSSGVVEAVGNGVVSVKKGDRVALSWSVHAQYVCLPERLVYLVPDNVDFEQAALTHISRRAARSRACSSTGKNVSEGVKGEVMKTRILVAVVGLALTGLAEEMPTVESPFELKLGSDELAVRYPKALRRSYGVSISHYGANAVDEQEHTNWFQCATVKFAKPYHVFNAAGLNFTEKDKKLYEYELHKDCPESMSREDCIKMMEAIVAELNAHYGLKLKLGRTSVDQSELKGRDVYRSFAHTLSDSDFCAKRTNNVRASVYGMVNRKGGMSVGVNVTESVLASDVRMRQGRFFEGVKNGGKKEPFALPLGYNFGDVYTNRETVAVVPDCLTNWPAHFGWDGRVVPIEGKWRDFDGAFFRLTEFGRISSFAAVLSTNGIASVEALEKWATDVLESRKDELEFGLIGGMRFRRRLGEPSDYMACHLSSMGRLRSDVRSSTMAEIRRLDDGRAYLKISYSTDKAEQLDAPQRKSAADGVRRALKEVLGLDFDAETTNREDDVVVLSGWQRIDAPKGMFTEGRYGYERGKGRLCNVRLRRCYEGDVSKDEMEKAVRELIRSIEAKAGKTLPLKDSTTSLTGVSKAALKAKAGETLCYGDWFGGTFPTYEATAKVGDMSFEVSYAVPQYVKDGDGYLLVMKGGIVLGISREKVTNLNTETQRHRDSR